MDVAVDVDQAGSVESLRFPSSPPIKPEVKSVVRGKREEIVRNRIVVRKIDSRANRNRENVRNDHLSARHHLELSWSGLRGSCTYRFQPDDGFAGDGILTAFRDKTDLTSDVAGREGRSER